MAVKKERRRMFRMWTIKGPGSNGMMGYIEAYHEYAGVGRDGEFNIDLFEEQMITITFPQTKKAWKEAWQRLRLIMPGVEYEDECLLGESHSFLP